MFKYCNTGMKSFKRKSYQKSFIFFLILLLSLYSSAFRDTLTPTQTQYLSDGDTLISAGRNFALGFFTPAKSKSHHRYVGIWYNKIAGHAVIWVANRLHPVNGTTGILSITTNGSLVITDANSTGIWSFASTTTQITNPIARLLDTGNFVVSDKNDPNDIFWQSFDYPTDTLIPGMKLGWDRTSGLSRSLIGWSSSTDPSPGKYTLTYDRHGVPQVILWAGSSRIWRSGPWVGALPFNGSYFNFKIEYIFVNKRDEVSFTADVANNASLTRMVLNSSGFAQRFVLLGSGEWGEYTHTPQTQCDRYGQCGPYSVCNVNKSPTCTCLPGFEPKWPELWGSMNYSGGCIRRTALECRSGSDGFVTVQWTLLPDSTRATLDTRMGLDECRAECLRNCSCTGFASTEVHEDGNGCIMWFTDLVDVVVYPKGGRDLHVRLAAADVGSISSKSHKMRGITLVIVLSIILGTLLLACTIYCTWKKNKQSRGNNFIEQNNTESAREDNIELPLFDLGIINTATNNFSNENKLGEGGFGPVYKGKMREGYEVAVKRLSKSSTQGLDELMTEVMLTVKLQHRNLVRLLGCCIHGDERMLIYEYMPNKSLDAFLFDEEKRMSLNWERRYQIILGIARGLLYLHQDSRFRIIHRDLKASNVLLDKDMNPKISDFGLARTFGGDETKTTTRRIVGTYGYMSPEYALNGIFSVKSDVFSFGVLVLEIISGKRNKGVYFSQDDEYLIAEAWAFWEEDIGLQLVDASLDCSFSMNEVLRCIKVGLLCVQECPEDRPAMSSVVMMLSSEHAFLPEPKKPGYLESFLSENSSSENGKLHSINDVTITMPVGR